MVRNTVILEAPQKRTFSLACVKFSGNNREGSFRFVIALMNGSVHAQQMKKQQINRQWPARKFTPVI